MTKTTAAATPAKKTATKAVKAAKPAITGKRFKLTLLRGMRGMADTQRRTLAALKLSRREHSVVIADNPANRGQILKIQHLVSVEVLR